MMPEQKKTEIFKKTFDVGEIPDALKITPKIKKIIDAAEAQTTHAIGAKAMAEKEMTPEVLESLVKDLQRNFEKNNKYYPQLHPNIRWEDLEEALRANPRVLLTLHKMQATDGMPDVFLEEADSFVYCDTALQGPSGFGRTNVVYDATGKSELLDEISMKYPIDIDTPEIQKNFENEYLTAKKLGTVVDRAEEMGGEIMDAEQLNALIAKKPVEGSIFLKTPENVRSPKRNKGSVFVGHNAHGGQQAHVNQEIESYHSPDTGFRLVVRLPKKAATMPWAVISRQALEDQN